MTGRASRITEYYLKTLFTLDFVEHVKSFVAKTEAPSTEIIENKKVLLYFETIDGLRTIASSMPFVTFNLISQKYATRSKKLKTSACQIRQKLAKLSGLRGQI